MSLYSPFQTNETLESLHNWLLSNWGRLLNWKGSGTPNCLKSSWYSYISIKWSSVANVAYLWVLVQKIYSKMQPVSCTNTLHDVTDLLNHGMVKNTRTGISWEQNITFLRNKKILNLCLKWHILKSYRFVAEVTFSPFMLSVPNDFDLSNPTVTCISILVALASFCK